MTTPLTFPLVVSGWQISIELGSPRVFSRGAVGLCKGGTRESPPQLPAKPASLSGVPSSPGRHLPLVPSPRQQADSWLQKSMRDGGGGEKRVPPLLHHFPPSQRSRSQGLPCVPRTPLPRCCLITLQETPLCLAQVPLTTLVRPLLRCCDCCANSSRLHASWENSPQLKAATLKMTGKLHPLPRNGLQPMTSSGFKGSPLPSLVGGELCGAFHAPQLPTGSGSRRASARASPLPIPHPYSLQTSRESSAL